ncbi:10580_t:CDS:2, partial [Funneliformis geosporum]
DSRSPSKKQNTFVACTGCTFYEESQCARLPVATQQLLCGNLIDSDLSHLIQTNYFTSVNSEKLYILKRNIKTVSDQAIQRYLDMRLTIVPNNLLINVKLRVTKYLCAYKFTLNIADFVKFIEDEVIPAIGIEERQEYKDHSKNIYFDGHE